MDWRTATIGILTVYSVLGAVIACAMLHKSPFGKLDWQRFCLNVVVWPLLIRGKLL